MSSRNGSLLQLLRSRHAGQWLSQGGLELRLEALLLSSQSGLLARCVVVVVLAAKRAKLGGHVDRWLRQLFLVLGGIFRDFGTGICGGMKLTKKTSAHV